MVVFLFWVLHFEIICAILFMRRTGKEACRMTNFLSLISMLATLYMAFWVYFDHKQD